MLCTSSCPFPKPLKVVFSIEWRRSGHTSQHEVARTIGTHADMMHAPSQSSTTLYILTLTWSSLQHQHHCEHAQGARVCPEGCFRVCHASSISHRRLSRYYYIRHPLRLTMIMIMVIHICHCFLLLVHSKFMLFVYKHNIIINTINIVLYKNSTAITSKRDVEHCIDAILYSSVYLTIIVSSLSSSHHWHYDECWIVHYLSVE